MCAPSFEKLQCTDFWKTPRAIQLVHPRRDQCTVCLNASGRSFCIILCITAVDFSIQTDVCQVRMVARLIYISPTTAAAGRKPKLMSVPTFRFNQRSPCRDAIEVWWKTVVSVEVAGALKVLGHCKSRECSNLSRFQRHWSSTGRLIIEHQFINISHESLKIYIWRLSADIS